MFKKRDSITIITCRLFLAITFILSGLSGFFEFETFGLFTVENSSIGVITKTPHYYALKGIELIIGLSFIANYFVQTALLIAMPVLLGAIGYHFWDSSIHGIFALLAMIPTIILVKFYKDTFALFFKPQMYTNHMAEETPKVLTYNEVREKTPGLEKKFEEIYIKVSAS